jgi:DNA recombination protein RmuC
MLALIAAIIALIAGVLLGFGLRGASAKSEKSQLELRLAELARDLNAARSDLAQSQAESAARAKFEALAEERENAAAALSKQLLAKTEVERALSAQVKGLEADLRNERQNLAEKLALLESAKKTLSDQFQSLASGILEQKAKSFAEGSQKELGTLLDPLKTQIKEFREKVEQAQSDSKTGVAKLEGLIGNLGNLNQQISEQARKAGLREGQQYSFQQNFSGVAGEEGEKTKSVRTDVIVSLPGERSLVIDSKVSLNSYTDYVNAEQQVDRAAALKRHLESVRKHVSELAKAGYHRLPGVETPDFVVMFVPIEPAFLLALQNDAELWADAYRQGILLVGPTTLLYIIRIVNVLWDQERQARNVRDVMDRGAELYDKFVNFVADLEKVGASLHAADANYASAMKKLSEGRGNLIRQVEMLKELGVRSTKSLPQKLLDEAAGDELDLTLTAGKEAEA